MSPSTVAVIGASDDPTKFGGRVFSYLTSGQWAGRAIAVNPRLSTVQGHPALRSITEAGIPVDLAVIAVPSEAVEEAVTACVQAGVRASVVFASGFAESGSSGRLRQEALVEEARRGGMRLVGPNCIGTVNVHDRFAASFATMWSTWHAPGPVSIFSQSGAMASYCYELLRERGVGVSNWMSTGNEADVTVGECIAHVTRDPRTRVVLAALEGVSDGPQLVRALAQARSAGKAVIVLKVGRSQVGQAAAASHTGSLAGEDRVFDAAVRQAGAIVVRSFSEAIDLAIAFALLPMPAGRRLGIVSCSGGGGIMAADRAQEVGLSVPELEGPIRERLDAMLPGGNSRNPVDVTAMVLSDIELMVAPIAEVASSLRVDAIVVFLTSAFRTEVQFDELVKRFDRHDLLRLGKPIALSLVTSSPGVRRLVAAGYPCFMEPAHAVDALAAMCSWRDGGQKTSTLLGIKDHVPPVSIGLPEHRDEASLLEYLTAFNVPGAATRLARSREEALHYARELGPVVVMKVSVPGLAHKTELGGVLLGIAGSENVASAWEALNAKRLMHDAGPNSGVIVQRQMTGVAEIVIGAKRDRDFGPVLMVGLGGQWVEVLDDVSLRLAPVSEEEAHEMLNELRGIELLRGARGRPKADLDAAARAIAAFSHLVAAADIDSLEINPFVLGAVGQGGWAVDAKLVAGPAQAD
jgi:acetate---CoA ligase (ADP-forming)